MNRENVEKLRDYLRDVITDDEFDMEDAGILRWCGKKCPTCIGGHARILFIPYNECNYFRFGLMHTGIEYLGLTRKQVGELFYPSAEVLNQTYEEVTRTRAVATLTRLLETSEIDWG